jgi:hypothetical protein
MNEATLKALYPKQYEYLQTHANRHGLFYEVMKQFENDTRSNPLNSAEEVWSAVDDALYEWDI